MKTRKILLAFLAFIGAMYSINVNAQYVLHLPIDGKYQHFYLPEDSVDTVWACASNWINWDNPNYLEPTGDLVIPSEITFQGNHYFVKGIYWNAFNGCNGIRSVEISDGISTIGMNAFKDCSRLKSVIVGADVYSVEPYAFVNCTEMEFIKSKSINMHTTSQLAFEGVSPTIPVYIPCDTKPMYEEVWDYFPSESFVEKLEMTYDVSLSVNYSWQGEVEITEWGTCENPYVEITAIPNSGYRFEHWNDGNTENPRIVQLVSNVNFVANFGINYTYFIGNSTIALGCSGGSFVNLPTSAYAGDTVCFSISVEPDSKLESIVIAKSDGSSEHVPLIVANNVEHYYCFVMPDCGVSVQANFVANTAVDENGIFIIAIYPNPVKDKVTIEAENIKHVSISNVMGQLIYEGLAEGDSFEYDFSSQEAGVYLIRIETSNGMVSKRIVVTK